MKQTAFTLLELLVVITIIGILSSIVIVSMSNSTDSAAIAKGKAYAQQINSVLGDKTVLSLNFNENATGTCPDGKDVCDASGYNNNGTIYGASYVSSLVDGYALSFDGVDDYAEIRRPAPSALIFTGSQPWTFEHWIKFWDQTTVYAGKLSYGPYFYISNTQLGFRALGGVEYGWAGSSLYNRWHYIAWVADGNGNLNVYLNGVSQGSKSVPTTMEFERIGKSYGGSGYFLKGFIDEIRVYAEDIPATEIQKHYVQGLEKLLANQAITQAEYDQRMEEFNQSLVQNRF